MSNQPENMDPLSPQEQRLQAYLDARRRANEEPAFRGFLDAMTEELITAGIPIPPEETDQENLS